GALRCGNPTPQRNGERFSELRTGSSAYTRDVQRQARVLIVDDDALLVAALARAAVEAGLAVSTVLDGAHALELCASERPDLVLLDVNLPTTVGRRSPATHLTVGRRSPAAHLTGGRRSPAAHLTDGPGGPAA